MLPSNNTLVYFTSTNSKWFYFFTFSLFMNGLPDSSFGKESACDAGGPSSIPGSGRSAGEEIGYPLQYSRSSCVAQLVKNPPAILETWVWSLSWSAGFGPLEKGKATHSSILAWRIPWMSMGLQRVGHGNYWLFLSFFCPFEYIRDASRCFCDHCFEKNTEKPCFCDK